MVYFKEHARSSNSVPKLGQQNFFLTGTAGTEEIPDLNFFRKLVINVVF